MTCYYDHEYREEDADIECAFPIDDAVSVSDPLVELRTIPAGRYLSIIHTGSLSELSYAWTRLLAYAQEKQYGTTIAG